MARVVALLAYDVGQEAAPRVYEPVAHLVDGEAGAARQVQLLVLGRIGVVAVLVQPDLEHLDALLGQVAASFARVQQIAAAAVTARVGRIHYRIITQTSVVVGVLAASVEAAARRCHVTVAGAAAAAAVRVFVVGICVVLLLMLLLLVLVKLVVEMRVRQVVLLLLLLRWLWCWRDVLEAADGVRQRTRLLEFDGLSGARCCCCCCCCC